MDRPAYSYLKEIKHSFIYSNLWVALSLASLSSITALQFNGNLCFYTAFCFSIAFAGYNYMYWSVFFTSPSKLNPDRRTWMQQHKPIMLITGLLTFATCIFLSDQIIKSAQTEFLIFIILSSFYIIPTRKNIGLRWIPGVKILIITSAWTLLSTLQISNTDIKQSTTIYISIWLIILSVTIPFDIRDIRTDHLKMKTIPQLIGIN
ncbi:MAG: hypothetical protein MI866_16875, partial [Bacteroidales bacterium]|nr:hypothetical protein [Bacteroidales bacterium]